MGPPTVTDVTLREVARQAGVSVSTASRVLNDQPFVRSEVRERVMLVSRELGYRPDVAARSMRTGTTGAIALVVSDISNPLFATIAKSADEALSPRGYSLMVANSSNDPAHEEELMAALRQRRLDGLVIAVADEGAAGLRERLEWFQAVVLLDREIPPHRLLVMDVTRGDGWDLLCPFLGLPIPSEPFPHENRTAPLAQAARPHAAAAAHI